MSYIIINYLYLDAPNRGGVTRNRENVHVRTTSLAAFEIFCWTLYHTGYWIRINLGGISI